MAKFRFANGQRRDRGRRASLWMAATPFHRFRWHEKD
jgi:hypothetical protein